MCMYIVCIYITWKSIIPIEVALYYSGCGPITCTCVVYYLKVTFKYGYY